MRRSMSIGPVFVGAVAVLLSATAWSPAATITIHNSSDSYYQIRDESAGNVIVVSDTNRRGSQSYALTDGHNYRLRLGQNDNGSHYFKVTAGGVLDFDPLNEATPIFNATGPTSLYLGSVAVYMRQISGPLASVTTGGSDSYFAPFTYSALGAAGQRVVHLAPDDTFLTSFGGFDGVWKNIFPFSFVQHTPLQLGRLGPEYGYKYGIINLNNPGGAANPGQTTITSLTPMDFFENGTHFVGFQFTVDRSDGAQFGDGSVFQYLVIIPEPASLVILGLMTLGVFGRRRGPVT